MNSFREKVIEQNKVKSELEKIILSRRVPHAFIFNGQEGVGKFNTAIQFIKEFITNYNDESILKKYEELQEPYIKLIFPMPRAKNEQADDSPLDKLSKEQLKELQEKIFEKSKNPYIPFLIENANQIRINSIRDIKKFSNLSSKDLPRFVIIIDAHLMNEQAQNALLKTLEEPPSDIYLILITTNLESLLTTVQSRCRIINFEPLSEHAVSEILIKYFEISDKLAKNVSKFSFGSFTQALKLANYELDKMLELTIDFLRNAFTMNRYFSASNNLKIFLEEFGEEQIPFFINLVKLWLIDAIRNKKGINNYSFEKYSETFKKFNTKYPNANLDKLIYSLDTLENYYKRNLNLNVFFLSLIFEINSVVKRI
ncbi:MAG: hypothetical protein N2321_09030 [Melioribacteraceae bacterium]|nr:hypothetical protein [Melioribacteraceae bacterium]